MPERARSGEVDLVDARDQVPGSLLDRNPLEVEPMAIKDIRVVETIKEGATIYPAR